MKYPLCWFAIASVGGAAGCTDARGAYDDYKDRVPDAAPTVDIDGGIVSQLPDVTGEFYLAARPDLPETRLIHIHVDFVLEPVTENTGLLSYTARFLDYTTLEPVGAEVSDADIPVASDTSFELPLAGTIPAAANSITGTNASMDGLLIGSLPNADFMCGTAEGTAGALNLQGTTWAGQRITEPGALPPVVWRCEDQPPP